MIKVKAIRTGFYGGQLRIPETPSEFFEVKDKKEMGDWMIQVEPEPEDTSDDDLI